MIGREEKNGIQKEVTINRKKNLKIHRLYWIVRRAQDTFFSAIALIALRPVMLITALTIVINNPGDSSIFAQDRVGRNGKLFKSISFDPCVWMLKQSWRRCWYRMRWMVLSLK